MSDQPRQMPRCHQCGHDVFWHDDMDGGTHECNAPNCQCDQYQERDNGDVTCLDCGWLGRGYELIAQACPVCDGRVADV